MKLTAAQLRSIIKEETKRALREGPEGPGSGPLPAKGPDVDTQILRCAEALEAVANDLDKALSLYPQSVNYSKENATSLKSILASIDAAAADLEAMSSM